MENYRKQNVQPENRTRINFNYKKKQCSKKKKVHLQDNSFLLQADRQQEASLPCSPGPKGIILMHRIKSEKYHKDIKSARKTSHQYGKWI